MRTLNWVSLLLIFSTFLIVQIKLHGQNNIAYAIISSNSGTVTNSNYNLRGTAGQPLIGLNFSSSYNLSGGFWFSYDILTDVEFDNYNLPTQYRLFNNYPNPFNPSTTIIYQIPKQSIVILKIYDVLGREIAVLVNEEKPIGNYKIIFNANGLSSGIYFYRLVAGSFIETKRMVLLK